MVSVADVDPVEAASTVTSCDPPPVDASWPASVDGQAAVVVRVAVEVVDPAGDVVDEVGWALIDVVVVAPAALVDVAAVVVGVVAAGDVVGVVTVTVAGESPVATLPLEPGPERPPKRTTAITRAMRPTRTTPPTTRRRCIASPLIEPIEDS